MRHWLAVALSVQLALGCSLAPPQIWSPSASADPLFRFERDSKVGFIDSTGKVVIEPTLPLEVDGSFHGGLLPLSASGPFIDMFGTEVIGVKFKTVFGFSEGLAPAIEKSGNLGYIDQTGSWVISPSFTHLGGAVHSFSEGLAVNETPGNISRAGYIDRTGEFAIPQRFLSASSFSEGLARVLVSGPCVDFDPKLPMNSCDAQQVFPSGQWNQRFTLPCCRWSYIDKAGNRAFAADFEDAGDFHEGLAAVKLNGKWGFIDKRGVSIIPPAFTQVDRFREGLAFAETESARGYIDQTGKFQFSSREHGYFSEGVAVSNDSLTGYVFVDRSGKQAVPGVFRAATNFVHGVAHVKLTSSQNGEADFAYIDHSGRQIFKYRGRL